MRSSSAESEWWEEECVEDIHLYLLKREKRCIPYTMRSNQLPWRQSLIEYLCCVCEKLMLCTSVKHLAAYILDLFMDNYSIVVQHFQFVILGCVVVAAKVDEKNMLIPRMSELNAFTSVPYKLKEFVHMEVFIMEFFNWDLLMPTVATFVEYYGLHALLPSDCYAHLPVKCYSEAKTFVSEYVDYFLNISLHEVTFRLYYSSLVAASCVAAARICLNITPSWPQHLHDITHYSLPDLKGCIEVMTRILEVENLQKLGSDVSSEGNLSPYASDDGSTTSGFFSDCSTLPTDHDYL